MAENSASVPTAEVLEKGEVIIDQVPSDEAVPKPVRPTHGVVGPEAHVQKLFRSVFFQVTVVGMCAFVAPGLFNAMTATGAGGAQSPYLVNTANAILYALLAVVCCFGGFVTNRIGFRAALAIGTTGYGVYAGGLYANRIHGTEWVILLGATLCGISGGIFWAVEGAVLIGYPQASKVGRYLGVWLAWRNAGSLIGASINLGLNIKTSGAGSLSPSTYIVFIVLRPFIALFLSEPDKVQRPDGTPVMMANSAPFKVEAKAMYSRILTRWDVFMLLPIMLYVTWFNSYAGTYLALYFSVRSRVLAAFVSSLLSIFANFVLGWLLDWTRLSKKVRARAIFATVMMLNLVMWVWLSIKQVQYKNHPVKALDWAAGGVWYQGWGAYVLAIIMYNINTNLLYWVISTLSAEGQDAVRLAGLLRGVEAAGSAFGFAMNTQKTLSLYVPLFFNFALCILSTACAYPVIHRIGADSSSAREDRDLESHQGR